MASPSQQYPPYDPYDPFYDADAPTGHRYSFGDGADLREFRGERQLLFPDCDHDLITDPRGLYGNHHHSPTEDAIFDGDLENEKHQFEVPVNHPLSTKTEVCVMKLTSMTEDIRQTGSLFGPPVDESMGENEPSECIPVDAAMEVCDKVPAAVPANSCGAQIAEDTQATPVTQDIAQLRERPEEQSGQEEPTDPIVETVLEKQNTTGSPDDDAGDIAPMSPPSPQPSSPESCSNYSGDYSSDSTSASSTGSSKLSPTNRRNNPNKRRRSDRPSVRKKNKHTYAEPYGSQLPPRDKTSQSRQLQMVIPMRPLQAGPVNVPPSDDKKPQISVQKPPPKTQRADKMKYTKEKKADQAASRKMGSCTECKRNKRNCDIAKKPIGEPCSSCAKRIAKRKPGEAPLTCVSWKNKPPQRPPSTT